MKYLVLLVQQLRRDNGLDDTFHDVVLDLLIRRLGIVLGRHDHGVDAHGLPVAVLHRHLGLAIGAQVREQLLLADEGEAAADLVRQRDRQRHHLWSLVAGETDHHALIAGADGLDLCIGHLAPLRFQRLVHSQGDVGRLLLERNDDATGIAVKAVLGPGVADFADGLAGQLSDVHVGSRRDLAHHHDQAGGGAHLAGYSAVRVILDDRVQHRVRDLIADLVRMSFSNRFGCQEKLRCSHKRGAHSF